MRPDPAAAPRTPRTPWTWTFYSAAELRVALEEYTAFEPGVGVPDGGGMETDEPDRIYRIYAQNHTIDRGMRELLKTPKLWLLLHRYYRQGGWSEFKGWMGPAREFGLAVPTCPGPYRCRVGVDNRMDLPTCPSGYGCLSAYDRFQASLAMAIEALLRAIKDRQQRMG